MFEEILARLAAALRRHDIPAMIIGGQAVLLCGEPRLTRGIDVTLRVGADRFATAEDVIIHKIFAGRPRDLEDVASILRSQPGLDRAYIRRWLAEFDAEVEDPVFISRFREIAGA